MAPAFRPTFAFSPSPSLRSPRCLLLVLLCSLWSRAAAYIPAWPSGDTSAVLQVGTDSQNSTLAIQWASGAQNYSVDYQLVASTGAAGSGTTQGAFVHFSESNYTDATTTPWIALISCDSNASDPSPLDVFTTAKSLGAQSALLYSITASVCIINPNYATSYALDVFITTSQALAEDIQGQFGAINSTYASFNSTLLASQSSEVQGVFSQGAAPQAGFMLASLVAFNATSGSASSTSSSGGGPNTSLAMIILYAITGCVSALFCVVIVSGAVRAIRHPERYGPRAGDAGFGGASGVLQQSRARGLTRAILDTFPVVKFGTGADDASVRAKKDLEADGDADSRKEHDIELQAWELVDDAGERKLAEDRAALEQVKEEPEDEDAGGGGESPGAGNSGSEKPSPVVRPRRREDMKDEAREKEVVPDAIGRETCPICIVDFQEGDDLRVLPCEGHHRFHQECVDQWLLELSSSCPICRQDFHALETMMAASGDTDDVLEPPQMPGVARPLSTAAARFSRYLRSARRRRRNREDGSGYDATNPPMPLAHAV